MRNNFFDPRVFGFDEDIDQACRKCGTRRNIVAFIKLSGVEYHCESCLYGKSKLTRRKNKEEKSSIACVK